MPITFDINLALTLKGSPELLAKLDWLSSRIDDINLQGVSLMAAIDDLRTRVQEHRDVSASAMELLQGLKAQLDAAIASGDMAQVQALSDQLATQNQQLADAVAANTPTATP
jgi:chromosome segregation ATPase